MAGKSNALDNVINLDILGSVAKQKESLENALKLDADSLNNIISLELLEAKPKKFYKCEHISLSLECMAGGFGHIGCLDQDFHEKCEVKKNVKEIIESRGAKNI